MKEHKFLLKILAGPLAGAFLYLFLKSAQIPADACIMAAITAWVATWWMLEPVDLAVTSLLPFVIIPLSGIMDAKTTAIQYMDQVIFLFIGGFILSIGVEKTGLHKRIASFMIKVAGTDPAKLLAGVMLSSFLISMWISNTATVLMFLPPVLSIINVSEKQNAGNFFTALLIGLAYSASIGGMATPVGTPTNMIFLSYISKDPETFGSISFLEWIKVAMPIAFVLVIIVYGILYMLFLRKSDYKSVTGLDKFIHEPGTRDQRVAGIIFLITIILWFTRVDIDLGPITIKGWSGLFPNKDYLQDSTVAILMGMLLFFIPSEKKGERILSWDDLSKLPFGVIFLFGSGFALAKGFEVSGLSKVLGESLNDINGSGQLVMLLLIAVIITVMSEFASNVATIQLALPILASISVAMNIHPMIIMLPATLAASLGFMLPVATAPNTIVFGTRLIKTRHMMAAGLMADLAGIVLISAYCWATL